MATVTYNGRVITQLQGGRTGVIDFADEKMYTDITVEGAEDTEVRYKGTILAKGRKVIVHCAGMIMRGEMLIAAAGRLKLDAPVIYISKKLDAPVIFIESATDGGGTLAILGKAILGKAILGDDGTYAILGRAILGMAILGKGGGKTKLDTPVIRLVSGDKLGTPVIELVSGEKLDAPVIYLDTGMEKLDAPTIYIETESELIKLDTPTIYIKSDPVEPDVPELEKLGTPEIYIYTEEEPDEPIVIKLDTPVIYIEAETEPEIIKLDTPEIRLESSGVKWNKYNTVATEHYRYVQDDATVGENRDYTETNGGSAWFSSEYWLSESSGFYGMSNIPIDQAAGNYRISDDSTEVWYISNVTEEPVTGSVHYHISASVVASATRELDVVLYSKGDTLLGTVEADEGEMPADGEKLDEGNGWYIIKTTDGIYYYEREV